MTVTVRKAQFQAIIGAGDPGGNQDIVIPGFGTVAAAVFALTKATVNTGQPSAPDSGYSVGYTDMTNTCSFSYFEEDNRAGSNTLRRSSNDSVIGVLDEIGIESIAELVGPVTDGLRIRWSDNLDAQYYFSVTLWGGVQAACGDWTQPAGDGATFKITLPFEMDVMYIAGTGNPINNLAAGNAQLSEGMIVNDRPGISQTAYCQSSEDSKAQTRLAGGMYQNLSAINHRLNSTLISRASFANLIESDGVTMETSTIGVDDFTNELGYLAIGLNGEAQAHLLTTETPDVTGLVTYTQPGFKPQYLDGIYTITNFLNASRTDQNVAVRSRRFVDENGETTQNFSSEDNSTTTIAKSLAHNAQLYVSQPHGGSSLIQATFSEFNANGWVDNYTQRVTRWFFILSIEEATTTPPQTVTVNALTLASSTPTISLVPGATSLAMASVSLASSVISITIDAGEAPTVVAANSLTMASSIPAVTIQPGEALIDANSLLLSSTIPMIVIQTIENQTVLAKSITLGSNTPAITVLPGGVSIIANSLTLGTFLIDINIIGAGIVQVNWLWLQSSAPGAAIVPGEVALSMNTLSLASSVETISLDLATLVMMATLQLNASAEPLQIAPGATSLLMDTLSLSTLLQVVSIISGAIPTSKTVYAEFTDVSPSTEFSNTSPRIDFEET